MASKQIWTVFAVYDDNEQSYVDHFEAKTWQEARSKALRKADAVILIAGIVPGKVNAVDVDSAENVVPIRGKSHAVEVAHVRVSPRAIVGGAIRPPPKRLRRCAGLRETHERCGRDGRVALIDPVGQEVRLRPRPVVEMHRHPPVLPEAVRHRHDARQGRRVDPGMRDLHTERSLVVGRQEDEDLLAHLRNAIAFPRVILPSLGFRKGMACELIADAGHDRQLTGAPKLT